MTIIRENTQLNLLFIKKTAIEITLMLNRFKYYLTILFLIALFIPVVMNLQPNSSEEVDTVKTQNHIDLGTNLSSINYYSSQSPFLNEFKSSKSWIVPGQQAGNPQQNLDTDESGWIKSLPSNDETNAV